MALRPANKPFIPYPSWRYSAKGKVLVKDPAEDLALGPGWYHSRADIPQAEIDAERDANDPVVLRARIAQLEAELAKRDAPKTQNKKSKSEPADLKDSDGL